MKQIAYIHSGLSEWEKMIERSIVLFVVFLGVSSISFEIRQLGQSVIQLNYGEIRGLLVTFKGSHWTPVEVYRGLKYGYVGNHKAYDPEWNKTHIANKWLSVCPQEDISHENSLRELLKVLPRFHVIRLYHRSNYTKIQADDCLALNVFLPSREWTDTTPFAVMVFVHGESYEIGTGNAYDGSVLASYGDVIVITINYRLGVLGFLNTGHSSAQGNQALMDILAVLQWVQDNIAAFNGDPKKVTLFGHGHGAALVNILMLSSLTEKEKYFQRAVIQSGSALSPWAVSYDSHSCAHWLARNVNCSSFTNDVEGLTKCLKSRSAQDLVNSSPAAPKYYSCMAPSPNPYREIFKDSVENLMKQSHNTFTTIPVIFGVTSSEAYMYLKQKELTNGISEERKSQILRTFVLNNFRFNRQKIYEVLYHQYTSWDTVQDDFTRRDNVLQLLSDGLYVAPLIKMTQQHSLNTDTYFYAFTHATVSDTAQYHNWTSAVHGDELAYIFGAPLVEGVTPFSDKFTPMEKEISKTMMSYWTNFAKTGDPNKHDGELTFEQKIRSSPGWPKYDRNQQMFLHFGSNTSVSSHYRGKQLSLWLDLIPKLNKPMKPVSDPREHELTDQNNMATFDEPHRLITNFKKMFPSHPPIPPSPPPFNRSGGYNPLGDAGSSKEKKKRENSLEQAKPPSERQAGQESKLSNSVPLSITVAIGCSLLFINILLFSAVYYQRRRIQRLNREAIEQEHIDPNDFPDGGHKSQKEETVTKEPPDREADVDLHSKPNIQSNPLYSVISKTPSDVAQESSHESLSTLSCASSSVNQKNVINHKSSVPPTLPKDAPVIQKDAPLGNISNSKYAANNTKSKDKMNNIRNSTATNDTITLV
ncbi:neuroligin-4, X-linked-like isoform X2 [Saccostrea echinata]|uniref:neuroligin-4, X-linked-like isoform X2 n=1 Tax=Saccostrea echinata TaxID=191078 RepID=UPI002A801A15|nr:neuroligin-4, X-linked-like isoform X2 [Saccostrea echinata]